MRVINPKVNVIDYGPEIETSSGKITPNDLVYGAARITYKDTGAIREILDEKANEIDREKIKKSMIKSAGAGHASMSTTPGLWFTIEGDCSKLVDSIFTGARYASSLMPSGRRVPIAKEQIVVPKKIHENNYCETGYLKTSEDNIDAYEKLQENGVPKQEASKIVQYGHRGGGFMFMPLETLINFVRDYQNALNNPYVPDEGKEVVNQLTNFVKSHGMDITYEARKYAPRASNVNPNIFHNRKNFAQEIIEKNEGNVLYSPALITSYCVPSLERRNRIQEFLETRGKIFSKQKSIKKDWPAVLNELEKIVEDYNDSISATIASNSPWRVWGEVKRHRALPQTAESIYNACDRALKAIREFDGNYERNNVERNFLPVVSIPDSVSKNPENLKLWIDRFISSMKTYENLCQIVDKKDAIAVVPRGLKLGIVKKFDLYNLTTGYMSLRLCSTAEPEMRRTTEQERDLILDVISYDIASKLIMPKCGYTGFCPDTNFCKNILKSVPDYDKEFHERIKRSREEDILSSLS